MIGRVVRRAIASVTGVVAALGALWTAILVISGGVDTTLFGRAVSSHEPLRPLLIAAVAFSIYILIGHDTTATRWARALARSTWLPRTTHDRIDSLDRAGHLDLAAVILLAVIALVTGLRLESRAAGGSDSYGYLAEAELFLRGNLKVSQPWVAEVPWPNAEWTFAPLAFKPAPGPSDIRIAGYRPQLTHDPNAIVPTYSPGLPILMAGAKWLAGNTAMFWIVPLSSAAFILATFGIGCRLGSRRLGTMAAFLVATSPPVIGNGMVTMTDMPVAAAWVVAIWCLMGESILSALGGAIALGIAVLIRPNLAPLLPVIGVWLALRVWRGAPHRWRHTVRGVLLLSGAVAGLLCTFAIFWTTYGSPFESGYGETAGYFSLSYIWPNLRNYSHWLAESQTPVIWFGFAALCLPIAALWPKADRTSVMMCAAFVAANFAEFIVYLVGDNRGYLRFFLPSYPFLMLGVSAAGLWCARLRWGGAAPLVTAATLLVGVLGVDFARRNGAFEEWKQVTSIEAGLLAGQFAEPNSVVLAMQHSGAIRYYGGRMTLRWDNLPPEWLDRAVAWLSERGVRTYVLVEPFELRDMKKRFAGQALAARLDGPPDIRLGEKSFFDLSAPPGTQVVTQTIPLTLGPGDSRPPAPPPVLVLRAR